ASCTTQKKAVRWMDKHPKEAAQYSLSRFPTDTVTKYVKGKEITKTDTTYVKDTTIIRIPVKDIPRDIDTFYAKVPINIPQYSSETRRTDTTIIIKDRLEYKVIIEEQDKEIASFKVHVNNLKKEKKTWILRFSFVVFLLGAGLFLK